MPEFTIDHLARILREGAGETEPIDWTGGALATPFTELGYDSIALLETAGRVALEFGARIDDDELPALETPQQFIDHVNTLTAKEMS